MNTMLTDWFTFVNRYLRKSTIQMKKISETPVKEQIAYLQKFTKEKITYEKVAKIIGLKGKQGIGMRVKRNQPLEEWEIEKIKEAYDICSQSPQNLDDCIEIEHIHINPSCGHGTVVMDEPEITPIKLGTQMIQSVLKISDVKKLKTFKACGDSMETVIEDGDILLVDTGRIDFNNGGIFLLTINNDWYVKRLRKRLSGELDVISDNNKYPIETFKPNDNIEIVVKGRVVKNLSRGL